MARAKKSRGVTTFVSSDWHLDWTTHGVARCEDVTASLEQDLFEAIARQSKLGPTAFVFLGDLCEDQSGRGVTSGSIMRALRYANDFARRLSQLGVEAWWIDGNHDVCEDGSGESTLSSLLFSATHRISKPMGFGELTGPDSEAFFALPYTASGLSYSPDAVVERRRDVLYPPPRVVFGHLNAEGITPGSEAADMQRGRDVFWPLERIHATWPGVTCVGGHIHRAQRFVPKGAPKSCALEIVGAPARFTFGEQDNGPSFMRIDPDGSVHREPFRRPRSLVTVDVDGSSLNQFGAALKRHAKALRALAAAEGRTDVPPHLLRVRYSGPLERADKAVEALGEGAAAVKLVTQGDAPVLAPAKAEQAQVRVDRRAAVLEVANRVASADRPSLLSHVGARLDEEQIA